MALEIERKFLVNSAVWVETTRPEGTLYRQGYLHSDIDKTVRVRIAGVKAFLTIKGKTTGASRAEFEYEIPVQDATELLDSLANAELSKIRYIIDFQGKTWEIDEFKGENAPLLLAEIELQSEDETFELPPWIAEEVTHDERYFNAYLAKKPYSLW